MGVSRLLTGLLLLTNLPIISSAQQQQPLDSQVTPSVAQGKSTTFDTPLDVRGFAKPRHPSHKRNSALSGNERAVATLAPAAQGLVPERAVRAPPATRSADGGLSSRLPARSLQDWEVEDIVLLATVDGTIHARDRRTGTPRWALEADRPMVETIYHQRNKSVEGQPVIPDDFLWIVEPSQDGSLYGFTPGSRFGLQRLGLTVKQLVEDLSPYAAEDPPVVYTGEKKDTLYIVDISNGNILNVFNAAGSNVVGQGSCKQRAPDFLDNEECEAVGTLRLGRTEYTIGVQSSATGEPICTIKYFEWGPNNRDRDLYSQYSKTKDNRYIYSLHDGMVLALDHLETADETLEFARKPTYRQKFSSPVVRVFDVARPLEESAPDTPLIILPQPRGPSYGEDNRYDDEGRVFVNCTDTGSWYALSENIYPLVTQRALAAPSSRDDFFHEVVDDADFDQLKDAIVGVHALSYSEPLESNVPLIAGPSGEVTVPSHERGAQTVPSSEQEPILPRFSYMQSIVATLILCFAIAGGRFWPKGTAALQNALKQHGALTVDVSQPSTPHAVMENFMDGANIPKTEVTKTVRFEAAEGAPPDDVQIKAPDNASGKNDEEAANALGTTPEDEATPKKKKAHRGKRGGKKLNEKAALSEQVLNGEQLAKVDSAEAVGQNGPVISVKPDAVNSGPGDDNNHPGLGNLKIDLTKVLGNGSGGTFVFEGSFEGRDVAVKRMLPQFFELASQEVSLLEQSEDHPNVIRYFCRREDSNFLYIALELCQASLYDLFKDGRREEVQDEKILALAERIVADPKKVLRQLAEGIKYLHSFRIVHRDIKPQNMLIARPKKNTLDSFPRFVISDFGLCKTLPDNASTLIGTTGNAGTAGWKAPELINKPKDGTANSSQHSANGTDNSSQNGGPPAIGGVKRAVDIFSLGCVFFYILTQGQHPFDDDEGWMALRERNIKVGRANFAPLSLFGPDTEDLIRWMLSASPEDRPTAAQVLQHPFFWDAEKKLDFLSIASDYFDQEARDGSSKALFELEKHAEEIIPKAIAGAAYSAAHSTLQPRGHHRAGSSGTMQSGFATQMVLPIAEPNFLAQLDKKFIDTLAKQRKYHPGKIVDLLRALRNKYHHWDDMPDDVKQKVGEVPEGYLQYWESRFPALIVCVWRVCHDLGWGSERRFWRFYDVRI